MLPYNQISDVNVTSTTNRRFVRISACTNRKSLVNSRTVVDINYKPLPDDYARLGHQLTTFTKWDVKSPFNLIVLRPVSALTQCISDLKLSLAEVATSCCHGYELRDCEERYCQYLTSVAKVTYKIEVELVHVALYRYITLLLLKRPPFPELLTNRI